MRRRIVLLLLFAGNALSSLASLRVAQPEFDSGHQIPRTLFPGLRWHAPVADVLLLLLALAVTTWAVHRARRRGIVLGTMLCCLAYFGFLRKGCVCAVGSIQNVVYAMTTDGGLALAVLIFFLAPLILSLWFGRVFCAAVCPLGALQDLFVWPRAWRLPGWLQTPLGILPHLVLAVGVVGAAGGVFLICRFDPLVGFFRLNGPVPMLLGGGILLALSVVIARPYCRFLCPYGVLLRWASWFSWRRVSTTPGECVRCGLCLDACPFGAIRAPTPSKPPESRQRGRRRLVGLLCVLPLLLLLGGWAGRRMAQHGAARLRQARLLAEVAEVERSGGARSEAAEAFELSRGDPAVLAERVRAEQRRVGVWGCWAGVYMGGVLALMLIRVSVYRRRDAYSPDPALCLACGRCYATCPVQREAWGEETRNDL